MTVPIGATLLGFHSASEQPFHSVAMLARSVSDLVDGP
jgi:hypothetical protein